MTKKSIGAGICLFLAASYASAQTLGSNIKGGSCTLPQVVTSISANGTVSCGTPAMGTSSANVSGVRYSTGSGATDTAATPAQMSIAFNDVTTNSQDHWEQGSNGDSTCPTTLPSGISHVECLVDGKINILQGATTSTAGTYAPEVKTLTTSGPITASTPDSNGNVVLTVTNTNYPAQANTWVPTQRFNGDALTNSSLSLVYTGGQTLTVSATTVNTAALPSGDVCTLNFTLANNTGPTYGIAAECHDTGGGRLFYHSGAHAIGSESWVYDGQYSGGTFTVSGSLSVGGGNVTGSNLEAGVNAVTSATTVLSTSVPENIVTLVSGAGTYSPTIAAGNTD